MCRFFLPAILCLVLSSCLPDPDGIDPTVFGQWRYFTQSDGLSEDYVSYMIEDGDGTIWFGHSNGLSSFDGADFKVYTTDDGLLDNSINCMVYTRNGDLLVGTGNGVSYRAKGSSEWKVWGLQGVSIFQILEDRNSTIWLATPAYGILQYKDEVLSQYFDSKCSGCNFVTDITEGTDGAIWFTTGNGVKVFLNDSFSYYTAPTTNIASNNTYCLRSDTWGNIWIGVTGSDKITKYNEDTFTTVDMNVLLEDEAVSSIANGIHGDIYVATSAHGLLHYDGVIFREIFEGPPDLHLTNLLTDSKGNLWMASYDKGVARYKLK